MVMLVRKLFLLAVIASAAASYAGTSTLDETAVDDPSSDPYTTGRAFRVRIRGNTAQALFEKIALSGASIAVNGRLVFGPLVCARFLVNNFFDFECEFLTHTPLQVSVLN